MTAIRLAGIALLLGGCGRSALDDDGPRQQPDGGSLRDGGLEDSGDPGEDGGPKCPECPEDFVCDPLTGACVPECTCASDADCSDGLACNGTERCNGCTCEPGDDVVCPDDGVLCTEDACNDDTGACVYFPDHLNCPEGQICVADEGCVDPPCAADGKCIDSFFCNGSERCIEGTCAAGPVPFCDDGIACTGDACDPGLDRCRQTPDDALCDDGLFCTGPEVCALVVGCEDGPDPSCADALACSIDSCDAVDDVCRHDPPDADRDGYGDAACGGDDCNDASASIHPGATEVCDGVDQNCAGGVDEGVLSECGDCRAGCSILSFPDEQDWNDDPGSSNGVTIEPDGDIVLESDSDEIYFAWIANTNDSTVTKLDTRTGVEVARYPSITDHPANGSRPLFEVCGDGGGSTGNCPSRTAVDLRGDVWVANRAFGHQGTVTKIANFIADCPDLDGDGTIDTSSDANGNGAIDMADPVEFPGIDDECVLFTVDVGESNARGDQGIPRAIAIDADGHPWVGLFAGMAAVELDPDDGGTIQEIGLDVNPYGAAIDSNGKLWVTDSCCGFGRSAIQSVDTDTGDASDLIDIVSTNGCVGSYGIAVDTSDRVWLAGLPCEAAFRYDPEDDDWFTVSLPGSGLGRGIAAATDGKIWMGSSNEEGFGVSIGRVTSFRAADGGGVRTYDLPTGLGTIGVGLDADGNVWAVNRETSNAARITVADGSIDEFDVGDAPYTYSDFTGYALRNITAPSGFHREIIQGCALGTTEWEEITWDATMPPATTIEVRVRSANTIVGLAAAAWIGPWDASPADLTSAPGPVPDGAYLEVEVTLFSDGAAATPTLHSLSVQVNCV